MWVHRRLFRPTVHGVRCVLVHGEDALLVRHTYGDRRWAWPGGMIRRGEPAELAARREIREELGLDIAAWRALGVFDFAGSDGALHVVSCFLAEASGELELERAEISEAAWFPLDRLPENPLDGTEEIAVRARAARRGV